MGASDAAAAEPLLAASGRGDADAAQARAANGARSNGVDADPESNSTPPPAHLAAWGESLATETRRVLALTGPAVASGMLSFASYLITTAQAGHLGASQLSGFTLARTIYHITGLSLVAGLSSGTDTFSGQAFGAGQVKLVGVYLQRSAAMNLLVSLPLLALWWFHAEHVMLLLGQEPDVVPLAAQLLRTMSPALLVWSVVYPINSYLTAQGQMLALTVISAVGAVATPLANWVAISVLQLGIRGVAAAYVVLAATELLAMVACMVWLHHQQAAGAKTWQGLDVRAAFSEWPAYLRISLPSMAMIALDWWFFEVVILIVGLQHEDASVQLGAMGLMFATHSLAFMVAGSYGQAAATRTSNELGAGHGAAARRATIVANAAGFATGLPIAAALYLFREQWAGLFASDPQVVATVVKCMFFLSLSIVADSVNGVMSGVLRGSGHQLRGFLINLVCFWLIGIPVAYKTAIVDGRGAEGIWISLSGVSLLQSVVVLAVVGSLDWEREARRAQELLASGEGAAVEEQIAAGGTGAHHGVYEPLLGASHA